MVSVISTIVGAEPWDEFWFIPELYDEFYLLFAMLQFVAKYVNRLLTFTFGNKWQVIDEIDGALSGAEGKGAIDSLLEIVRLACNSKNA